MKIGRVKVNNFRSINQVDFPVKSGVIGLVGGNESGKSNILLAIKHFLDREAILLDDRYQLSDGDIQIELTFNQLNDQDKEAIKLLTNTESNFDQLVIRRTYDTYELVEPVIIEPTEKTNESESEEPSPLPSENTPEVTQPENAEETTAETVQESSTIEGDPQPTPAVAEVKPLLDKDEILNKLFHLLPKVQYINSIDELITGSNIPISELLPLNKPTKVLKTISEYKADTLKKLLLLGGVTDEDLRLSDIGRKNMILNKKASIIAKKLRESWSHEDVKLRLFAGKNTLTINFRDGRNLPIEPPKAREDDSRWVWTLPEKRSVGFRWYVTFYTKFLYGQETATGVIYLIDDAGAPLNKIAQEDLLKEFNNIAGEQKNNQIFYSTHSKYMVGWDYKENILLVDKTAGLGTSASPKWWNTVDKKHWPAPLSEIGVDSHDFLRPSNLITEGLTDAMVLERVSFILRDSGIPESPFSDYHLLPSNGVPSMLKLGDISKAEEKIEYLLFDSDGGGITGKAGALGKKLRCNDLATLAENANHNFKLITIEDLLPQHLFLKSLNNAGNVSYPGRWVDIVRFRETQDGIISAIKTRSLTKGFTENEISTFIRERKYDIILETLQSLTDHNDYTIATQLESILTFFNNLKKELEN